MCNGITVQHGQDQGRSQQRSARAGEDVTGVIPKAAGVDNKISKRGLE